MTLVALLRRLRDEFTALPGLRLNEAQVQRLCGVSASTSASALRALVSAGFLRPTEDGSYRRADIDAALADARPPGPWTDRGAAPQARLRELRAAPVTSSSFPRQGRQPLPEMDTP